MKDSPDIVVGSGPSGVLAAVALLDRGRNVLLLDAGIALDAESAALRDRLGGAEPHSWTPADREQIGRTRRTEHSDSMRLFGSDFLFRTHPESGEWHGHDEVHALRPSFARGGLSNGWGASVLPYRQPDIAGWPISIAELEPHYRQVAAIAHVTNYDDRLAELFPVLTGIAHRALPSSRQARELVTRLERKTDVLADAGVRFGLARHAVRENCRACGQCLHGCPYRLIFNAGYALDDLLGHERLSYRSGRAVTRFAEGADGVMVDWGGEMFRGQRLFVACGVLSTARLVLNSLDARDRSVRLFDSALSYLPSLHTWSAGDPAREPMHSLSQAFIEVTDRAVDPHTVHAQIYTWNDTFAADMQLRFGRLAAPGAPLIHLLSRRLLVAQTFLHSDSSGAVDLALDRTGNLVSAAVLNPATERTMARATRAVGQALRSAGVVPLHRLRRDGRLAASFHCGGTFPMRKDPKRLETDIWGRPAGLKHVHIVDASTFPSIPATTITFTTMANAHRIAALSPD